MVCQRCGGTGNTWSAKGWYLVECLRCNGSGKESMKIGCDVDGVIASCGQHLLDYNVKLGNVPVGAKIEDYPTYQLENHFDNFSRDCFDDSNWWISMPVYNNEAVGNAYKFVEELHKLGELIFVSACFDMKARKKWLSDHGLHPDGFISKSGKEKAQFAKEEGFDIFIEDHPQTIVSLCKIGIPYVYAVEHHYETNGIPYNLSNLKEVYPNLRVVGNLEEILEDIKYVTGRQRSDYRDTKDGGSSRRVLATV